MSLDGDKPTTACDHRPANRGAVAGVACAICHREIERRLCRACSGSGCVPKDGTGDKYETCEECNGIGDGEWEVAT